MELHAYPNYSEYMDPGRSYDLQKWADTFKNIYIKTHFGASKNQAFEDLTKNWDDVEKRDFLNWMKYYESGDYLKYKQAQQNRYYANDDLNYFIPNPVQVSAPSPLKTINEQITAIPEETKNVIIPSSKEDKQKIVEEQRKKILGRLNSVEKLLSSQQGHMFAGSEFEKILHSIYELKKQIQTTNKITLSAQTCIDLIIRKANMLQKQGYKVASGVIRKIAQNTPGDFSFQLGEVPAGGSKPQGLGSLDNNIPDLSTSKPLETELPSIPSGSEENPISEFLENLEGGPSVFDKNEIEDEIVVDDDVLLDRDILPGKNDLMVEAQMTQPLPRKEAPKNLEVEEKPSAETQNIDNRIDNALGNVSIQDVVQELEEVGFIFKNREIVRKLSIVDMMLSKLNIAQYMPELSEVIAKNLDASQYTLTRLETILSRLRGGMTAYKTDLETNDTQQTTPLQQHFKGEENKERQRKDMQRKMRDQELMEASKPEATVEAPEAELAATKPTVEQAPPRPAPRPVSPTPAAV